MQMATLGVHVKGALPWLVRWARRSSTEDFCPALAALVALLQNINSSLHTFSLSPHRPATWTGSCAGSPVSVSLVSTAIILCVCT